MIAPNAIYQIRVAGQVDKHWENDFPGMSITYEKGEYPLTLFQGPVMDQSHLCGMLNQITGLGLVLIEVKRLEQVFGENQR